MSGKPSAAMMDAMRLVIAGVTPYRAAQRMQIQLSTMYKSRLYKLWKEGSLEALQSELNTKKPVPRTKTTKRRFDRAQVP